MVSAANDNNLYYTYIWRDSCGVPFYVGKGSGGRAYDVVSRSSDFREIYAAGGCVVEIVNWFAQESQAYAHECELISKLGRRDLGTGNLVNKTGGGEGVEHTLETRSKISAAKRGVGKSDETRLKMSRSQRELWRDADRRMRASEAAIDRFKSPDARAIMSSASLKTWSSPEVKERIKRAQRLARPRVGSSQFKGVHRDSRSGRWRAQIFIKGSRVALGTFDDEGKAAIAYDTAAYKEFGDDCYLNFAHPRPANDNKTSVADA